MAGMAFNLTEVFCPLFLKKKETYTCVDAAVCLTNVVAKALHDAVTLDGLTLPLKPGRA